MWSLPSYFEKLDFVSMKPADILVAHTQIAKCFAEDIRVCTEYFKTQDLQKYGVLMELADGENDTDNIQFEDYKRGDHRQFLDYFLKKRNICGDVMLLDKCKEFKKTADSLSPEDRFQLLVQTEMRYHQLFEKVLNAHNRALLWYDFLCTICKNMKSLILKKETTVICWSDFLIQRIRERIDFEKQDMIFLLA